MYSKLQDGSFMVSGFVARDAETRTTQSGKTLTTWSVAAARVKNQEGAYETRWTSCQAWHDAARSAACIKKGDTVLCIGRLETNKKDDKVYRNLVVDFFCKMPIGAEAAIQAAQTAHVSNDSAIDDLGDFEILDDGSVPF